MVSLGNTRRHVRVPIKKFNYKNYAHLVLWSYSNAMIFFFLSFFVFRAVENPRFQYLLSHRLLYKSRLPITRNGFTLRPPSSYPRALLFASYAYVDRLQKQRKLLENFRPPLITVFEKQPLRRIE